MSDPVASVSFMTFGGDELSWTVLTAPVGELTVVASRGGLLRVAFGSPEPLFEEFPAVIPNRDAGVAAEVGAQLTEYFEGARRRFDVPIDWSFAQGFRQHVLRTLYERVPFGSTVSYRELAEMSGRPTSARVVGTIMGSNPVPLVVPCHRVLATGGMGGYGPGLEAKRRLLVLEGVLEPTLLD
jgi:methylated-DNA-[protein]-cysteine S-methyltransferase